MAVALLRDANQPTNQKWDNKYTAEHKWRQLQEAEEWFRQQRNELCQYELSQYQ